MRIIEVTGVAGAGKSYLLDELVKRESIVLDTSVVEQYRLNDMRLVSLFFKSDNSFRAFILIVQIAMRLKMKLYNRLNFIRNSIKKIGKNYFFMHYYRESRVVLIDEGISHFYQNIVISSNQNNSEILILIDNLIGLLNFSHEIIVVDASSNTIFERLKSRGHKRLKSDEEIQSFIKKSKKNLALMKKQFSSTIDIRNENKIDLGEFSV